MAKHLNGNHPDGELRVVRWPQWQTARWLNPEGEEELPPPGPKTLARYIDHTLLKPEATPRDIETLCREALEWGFAAVCVAPMYVSLAADLLSGSDVKVCTVVGFPLGSTEARTKMYEAMQALHDGAQELDMVLPVGYLKAGRYDRVFQHIYAVVDVAKEAGARVKVILETGLLTPEEIVRGCLLAEAAGADFVKTSTGFGPRGATVEDVRLMRKTVGDKMGVKAAGGIRTYAQAMQMLEAGANRLGTSTGVRIMKEAQGKA